MFCTCAAFLVILNSRKRLKRLAWGATYGGTTVLQWGHRLSAMETSLPSSSPRRLSPCFNGATAFRRWKRFTPRISVRQHLSLQWGHRLSALETVRVVGVIGGSTQLQWGHRLSAMETLFEQDTWLNQWMLQWGHRLSAMETKLAYILGLGRFDASVGPPPFGDGNDGR